MVRLVMKPVDQGGTRGLHFRPGRKARRKPWAAHWESADLAGGTKTPALRLERLGRRLSSDSGGAGLPRRRPDVATAWLRSKGDAQSAVRSAEARILAAPRGQPG